MLRSRRARGSSSRAIWRAELVKKAFLTSSQTRTAGAWFAFEKAAPAQAPSVPAEPLTEFRETDWLAMVDYITVHSKKDIRMTFKDGTEIKA